MVQASLIAAAIASLIASIITWRNRDNGCTDAQTGFRVVAALVWLSLAAIYLTAYLYPNIFLIRSGILTRLLQITIMVIYTGDIVLGKRGK